MAMILKQSTAVDVLIGPFVDITDGATAETGESPSVKLSKNGQALGAKNDATTPVHDADGYHNCELDATDTNTVGTLVLTVAASATALPVRHEFQVVEEDTYEYLYASGAAPDTQIAAITAAVITNAAGADVAADIIAVKAETALIVADTNELQGDWTNGGRLDLLLDAIKVPTDKMVFTVANQLDVNMLSISGDGPAADNCELFFDGTGYAGGTTKLKIDAADIFTTSMTEAYAANAAAFTFAQGMYAIHQMLMQFGISGTSLTVRKLDNTTTAFVGTLDDATTPTDLKRV